MYGAFFYAKKISLPKKVKIIESADTSKAENNIIYCGSSSNIVRLPTYYNRHFFYLFFKTNWFQN